MAARRLISALRKATALGLGGVFMTACAAAPLRPARQQQDMGKQDTSALQAPPRKDKAEAAPALPQGAYAEDVKALQNSIDAWLAAHPHPFYDRAVVLDPDRFDIETASGKEPLESVNDMIRKGPHGSRYAAASFFARKMESAGFSRMAAVVQSVEPWTMSDSEARLCIVLPALPDAMPTGINLPLAGMDLEATLAFVNAHELWHCKDDFSDRRALEEMLEKADKSGDPALKAEANVMLDAARYKKESFADLGALGDMIRSGRYGTEVIDTIALWRAHAAEDDPIHMSAPALKALKAEIGKQGLEAFRAKSDEEAFALYKHLAESNGLATAAVMKAYNDYDEGNDKTRAGLRRRARKDPDMARAIALYRDYVQNRHDLPPNPIPHAAEARKALTAWRPMEAVEARAQEDSGDTGHDSLLKAYIALQAELRGRMKAEPDSALYPEQALRLRTAFHKAMRQPANGNDPAARRFLPPPVPRPGGQSPPSPADSW